MKNILRIISHDLNRITGSVVAIIIVMGLCIVPCLYAWFNIFSNWAPYESDATGRILVVVADMDRGSKAAGLSVNVGEKIVEALQANDAIGWVFADNEEEAIEGVYSGDYYAALVIPEDFTADVLSFTNGSLVNPRIRYYENEKKNAIAPKITGKAKTALQEEVNAAFVETLASYVSDAASVAEANGTDPADMLSDLSDKIEEVSGSINSCIALSDSASGMTDAAGNLLDVSDTFLGSTQDVLEANDKLLASAEKELKRKNSKNKEAVNSAIEVSKDAAASLKSLRELTTSLLKASDLAFNTFVNKNRDEWISRIDKMKKAADEQSKAVKKEGFTALASEFDDLSQTLADISSGLSSLYTGMDRTERGPVLEQISEDTEKAAELTEKIITQIRKDLDSNLESALSNARSSVASFRKAMKTANKDLGSLSDSMSSYGDSLNRLRSGIDSTTASLKDLRDGADSVAGLFSDASGNELLQSMSTLLADDEKAVAEYLANPIKMETEVVWPIENYGSAMAPFYTVLAQWVGALLTAVLIKVRIRKMKGLDHLKLHEWYLGRFGLYLLVGLSQGLIVSLGDLLYIGIQCKEPLLFVLISLINGMVFMMFNYALVFALDNIGLGAGVIILVLQVAGSGGTYPVEVLPGIFRTIYPLMPFRYSMDAMRECIGGMYDDVYWKCVGVLMIIFVFSIAFGMALYRPARRLNEMIASSKAKSEIML